MIIIPSIGEIEFDETLVPSGFCWSGHCKSIEAFKKANFLSLDFNGHSILICSDLNCVALGDYLGTYIDQSGRFNDTANFMNDSMVYWCYLAWEYNVPCFYELPDWVREGLYTVFLNQLVFQDNWIFLIDSGKIEGKHLPSDAQYRLDEICHRAVLDELQCKLDDDESIKGIEDLRPQGANSWIMATYEEFSHLKQIYGNAEELMVYCHTENGLSIGFGCPVLYSGNDIWIYEGVYDSLYENYEEFEESVILAAEASCDFLKGKSGVDLSTLSYEMIKKVLGIITVLYEADGKEVNVQYNVDIPDLIYSDLADYVKIEIRSRISD